MEYNIRLIITDGPNPLGGKIEQSEGSMLDEENCSSFIGRWNIPLKYPCTLGEFANYFKTKKLNRLQLIVIELKNWDRSNQKQFKFHPTSPAMQWLQTAIIYSGTSLLEGINANEGRGTDKAFRIFGVPWINKENLLQALCGLKLSYLKLKTITYTTTEGLYSN